MQGLPLLYFNCLGELILMEICAERCPVGCAVRSAADPPVTSPALFPCGAAAPTPSRAIMGEYGGCVQNCFLNYFYAFQCLKIRQFCRKGRDEMLMDL